eukprot:6462680-Amphidinium_carterae.1
MQVGAQYDLQSKVFGTPGLVKANESFQAKMMWVHRRSRDFQSHIFARAVYGRLGVDGTSLDTARSHPREIDFSKDFVVVSSVAQAGPDVGHHFWGVEFLGNKSFSSPRISPKATLGRKFYVYNDSSAITADIFAEYFNWTVLNVTPQKMAFHQTPSLARTELVQSAKSQVYF